MEVDGHEITTEVKNAHEFGFQEIIGYLDDDIAITLNDSAVDENFQPLWRITSSRTIPTTLDGANAYNRLIRLVLTKVKGLDAYKNAHRDLKDKILYNMDEDRVYTLHNIDISFNVTIYMFNVIPLISNVGEAKCVFTNKNIDKLLEDTIEISPEELKQLKTKKIEERINNLQMELLKID